MTQKSLQISNIDPSRLFSEFNQLTSSKLLDNCTSVLGFSEIKLFGIEKDIRDKIKAHITQKTKHLDDHAFSIIILFCVNCFIFILVRDTPFSLHNFSRIKYNHQEVHSYYGYIKYQLIYWVPNMILPFISGFFCDYAANDMIGVKLFLLTIIALMFLSQILIVINASDQMYELRVISRFIFSFAGETFFVVLVSSLSLWFKKKEQLNYICLFVFCFSIAEAVSHLIVRTMSLYLINDTANFLDISAIFSIVLFLLFIYNYFYYPGDYKISDKQFFDDLRAQYRNHKNSLYELEDSEQKEKMNIKNKIKSKEIFPTSICNALTYKILNVRIILLSLIHSSLLACFFVFQDFVIFFLFIDHTNWTSSNSGDRNLILNNPLFNNDTRRNSSLANFWMQILKSVLSLTFFPWYLKKTGNRNLLLTFSAISFFFSFSVMYLYFKTTLEKWKENTEFTVDESLNYFIVGIILIAISVGIAFQQNSFFTYIPILIEEKFYMTAYGFFTCLQAIFIVVFHWMINSWIINRDGHLKYVEFDDVTTIIGILILFLIADLALIVFLEYYDRKTQNKRKIPKLYQIEPKKSALEHNSFFQLIYRSNSTNLPKEELD